MINSSVRLAILDTREIHPGVSPRELSHFRRNYYIVIAVPLLRQELVSTLNFDTGSPSYVSKASRRVFFGETVVNQASSIQSYVPDLKWYWWAQGSIASSKLYKI